MEKIKGHQGDVQFKQIDSIPENAKKIDNTPLAYGELSGHLHVLTGDVDMYQKDNVLFADVKKGGCRIQHVLESNLTEKDLISTREIKHENHFSILLPVGIYEFGIHERYDPFEKIFKKVID